MQSFSEASRFGIFDRDEHVTISEESVISSKVSLYNVSKIFGDNPGQALELVKQGVSKEDILAKTKNVVGVVDVSFDVKPSEIFVVMGLSGSGKSTANHT